MIMSPGHRSKDLAPDHSAPVIFVVEDDSAQRSALRELLEFNDMIVEDFASAEDFLASVHPMRKACLLLDLGLPGGMGGMELLRRVQDTNFYIPTIFITGSRDVKIAVEGMRLGALDVVQKPIEGDDLLARIADALRQKCWGCALFDGCHGATEAVSRLTARQKLLMDLILAGRSGKFISADIGINQRTVEKHRAAMMKKMGATSIFALTQLSLAASGMGFCGDPIPGRGRYVALVPGSDLPRQSHFSGDCH